MHEEILTALTPEDRWRPMFAGVEQQLVVCGHTHAQSDRVLGGVRASSTPGASACPSRDAQARSGPSSVAIAESLERQAQEA